MHTTTSKQETIHEHSLNTMSESETLKLWRQTPDKDNLSHYQSESFRLQYAKHEMPKRARVALKWLKKPSERLLKLRPMETEVRLLSLGCGPGSDLLAGIECLLDQGLSAKCSIQCTGVDLMPWDRKSFKQKVEQLTSRRLIRDPEFNCPKVITDFCTAEMRNFVLRKAMILKAMADIGAGFQAAVQYDLITLSYANAKETLQGGLAECLTNLLRPGGSIVVLDNNTARLRRISQHYPGYKTICVNRKLLVLTYEAPF